LVWLQCTKLIACSSARHGAALCGGWRRWLPAMSNSCGYILKK
jgi:hypothetical protein